MKSHLSADEAAEIVGKTGKYLRARLRERKAAGTLDLHGAWQDPPKANGIWTVRSWYLATLATEYGWTVKEN